MKTINEQGVTTFLLDDEKDVNNICRAIELHYDELKNVVIRTNSNLGWEMMSKIKMSAYCQKIRRLPKEKLLKEQMSLMSELHTEQPLLMDKLQEVNSELLRRMSH